MVVGTIDLPDIRIMGPWVRVFLVPRYCPHWRKTSKVYALTTHTHTQTHTQWVSDPPFGKHRKAYSTDQFTFCSIYHLQEQ